MTQKSAAWGFLLLPCYLAWVLVLRVSVHMVGLSASVLANGLSLLIAAVATAITIGVAWENSPEYPPK